MVKRQKRSELKEILMVLPTIRPVGSELKQVLTTTRARRSTIRKSEQFIVEVSVGNATSLVANLYYIGQ